MNLCGVVGCKTLASNEEFAMVPDAKYSHESCKAWIGKIMNYVVGRSEDMERLLDQAVGRQHTSNLPMHVEAFPGYW